MSRLYDLMLLIDSSAPEDRQKAIVGEVERLLEQAAAPIVGSHDWGSRRIAFEIDHRPEAAYQLFQFEGDNALLDRLNHSLKIMDGVLRFRIIRQGPGRRPCRPARADPRSAPRGADGPRRRPRRRRRPAEQDEAPAAAEAPADAPPAEPPPRLSRPRQRLPRTSPKRPSPWPTSPRLRRPKSPPSSPPGVTERAPDRRAREKIPTFLHLRVRAAHARRPHGYSRSSNFKVVRRSFCHGSNQHQQGGPHGQPHARPRAAQHPQHGNSGLLAARRLQHPPQGRVAASGSTSPTTSTSPSGAPRARTAPSTCRRAARWRSTAAWSGASGRTRRATSASRSTSSPTPSSSSARATAGEGNGSRFTPQSDVPADTADFQAAPCGRRGGTADDDIPF